MAKKVTIGILSIFGFSIVVFPIALVAISYLQIKYKSIEDIEQFYGFSLPTGASNIDYKFSAVRDTYVRIKFTDSHDEIVSFTQQLDAHCINIADDDYFTPLVQSQDSPWSITEELSRESTHNCFNEDGRLYSYLVVPENELNSVIYLYVG